MRYNTHTHTVLSQEKLLCQTDAQKLKQDKNSKCFTQNEPGYLHFIMNRANHDKSNSLENY